MADVVAMTGGAVGQDAIARLEVRPTSNWVMITSEEMFDSPWMRALLACNESLSNVSCRSVNCALEEAGLC